MLHNRTVSWFWFSLTEKIFEALRDDLIAALVVPVDESTSVLDYLARFVSTLRGVQELDKSVHSKN